MPPFNVYGITTGMHLRGLDVSGKYQDDDTDGDGVTDGDEIEAGTDPLVAEGDSGTPIDTKEGTCGCTPSGASSGALGLCLTGVLVACRPVLPMTRSRNPAL